VQNRGFPADAGQCGPQNASRLGWRTSGETLDLPGWTVFPRRNQNHCADVMAATNSRLFKWCRQPFSGGPMKQLIPLPTIGISSTN
jgi:hypothetical protein